MGEVINIFVTIVTATTAIFAIILTVIQLQKGNKQFLFERRLSAYMKIKSLLTLCDNNDAFKNTYIKEAEDGPTFSFDMFFVYMTNTGYLEEIQPVIANTLESELQRKYLMKIEELKNLCEEVKLIFRKKLGVR